MLGTNPSRNKPFILGTNPSRNKPYILGDLLSRNKPFILGTNPSRNKPYILGTNPSRNKPFILGTNSFFVRNKPIILETFFLWNSCCEAARLERVSTADWTTYKRIHSSHDGWKLLQGRYRWRRDWQQQWSFQNDPQENQKKWCCEAILFSLSLDFFEITTA